MYRTGQGKICQVSSLLIFIGKNVKMKRKLPVGGCAEENYMLSAQTHMQQIQERNYRSTGTLDDQ
jgi:hypothetical protein